MEGFTNNGELTNPKSTEKTGWDELAESPIGKAPEESSQSEDEGDAAETSVSSRVDLSRYSASGEVPRQELEVERALGTLDATHKVPRNPGLPREEH